MVRMMIMLMVLMFTSKILRALAPVPAVMESPREAISPMSCGLSWWTLRWLGGWRSYGVEDAIGQSGNWVIDIVGC